MIWHFLKTLVSVILPVFYKRVQVKNLHFLKVRGPVVIAMNHPNAFTDPIYLTYLAFPTRLNYLARGDAFKPGFASFMLEKIGIIPIFRMRDGGKEGLKKNDETYRRVNAILAKDGKMMVFAEGLCIQERRLRPLKKGVARMVFGAYEAIKSDSLIIIPVGVNYSDPDKFRSTLFYNIGEPLYVKDYIPAYQENAAKAQNMLLQHLEPRMKELITHIEDPSNDRFVEEVEELLKIDELKKRGLSAKNLAHDFEVLRDLTEKVNRAFSAKPTHVEEVRAFSSIYFNKLKQHGLRDWLISPRNAHQVNYFSLFIRFVVLCAGFPIYLIGLIFNFLPMYFAHQLTLKIIKTREFYSSIVIGIAMVFFWISYLVIFFIIRSNSPNPLWPLFICLIGIFCGIISLYYYPLAKKTYGLYKALKNKVLIEQLKKERANLVSLINKF